MVQENRTFVCSVLFLDMVAYSEQPVADQMRLKQRFNALLGTALRNVAVNDRIVLDTGDGAAISFLGNPEDALFVAIELRDALTLDDPYPFEVRFGINLGPVRMITDINQRTNIIGNGINVAQRVMSFAAPGQILVSRSYFEVVACLSNDYAQLFSYSGSHTDKHVHEHEVYVVGATDPNLPLATPVNTNVSTLDRMSKRAMLAWAQVHGLLQAQLQKNAKGRLPVVLSLSLVLVVSSIIVVRAARQQPAPDMQDIAQGDVPMMIEEPLMEELVVDGTLDDPALADNTATMDDSSARSIPAENGASVQAQIQAQTVAAAARPTSNVQQAANNANVRIRITPWGEAFVDGSKQGTCSPICELQLPPGTRRIEARNPSAPARQEIITLKSGEERTVNFRF